MNKKLHATESELEQGKIRIRELEKELHSCNSRVTELIRRMTVESESTKKALEKAITSSVRLCVVAPTVNVHVADNKLKFKAA